jgi:hypothetical protein
MEAKNSRLGWKYWVGVGGGAVDVEGEEVAADGAAVEGAALGEAAGWPCILAQWLVWFGLEVRTVRQERQGLKPWLDQTSSGTREKGKWQVA